MIIRVCKNCSTKFEIENWRLKDSQRGKYCSIPCQRKYRSGEKNHYWGRSLKGEKNPSWKGGKPNCLDCGQQLSAYNYKRCRKCQDKFNVGENNPRYGKPFMQLRGENHPNWRGGQKEIRKTEMGRIEYILWRNSVFIRDDYTCQKCKIRGGKLNADHIKPWSLYPELRYAIDNGRTLCVDCHRQTDTWGFKGIPRNERRNYLRQY